MEEQVAFLFVISWIHKGEAAWAAEGFYTDSPTDKRHYSIFMYKCWAADWH